MASAPGASGHRLGQQQRAARAPAPRAPRAAGHARASSWSCTTRTSVAMSAPWAADRRQEAAADGLARCARPLLAKALRARAATAGRSNSTSCRCGARSATAQERALATADIQQAAVVLQRVGVQDFVGHQRLRGRHQRAVGATRRSAPACWRRRRASTVPAARCAGFAAQQGDRVGQVGIQRAVVFHHRGNRGLPTMGAPSTPSPKRPCAAFDQAQRDGGIDSRRCAAGAAGPGDGQLSSVCGPLGQDVEQAQTHAGQQDLRIDKARHQVEQRRRAATGTGRVSGKRVAQGCRNPSLPSRRGVRQLNQESADGHRLHGLHDGRGRASLRAASIMASGTRRSDSARASARRLAARGSRGSTP
jgi:hypothetical protein